MYLNCHTYYSLKYGTISPQELVNWAITNGVRQLALTDVNNTSIGLELIRLASKHDNLEIKLGIDFRNGIEQQFVALAKNNQGYQFLNQFLSDHLHQKKVLPRKAPVNPNCFFIYPFEKAPTHLEHNEYIGLCPKQVNKIAFSRWAKHLDKLVVLQPISFQNKKYFNAHRILRAIDNNALLSQLSQSEQADTSEIWMPPDDLRKAFLNYPDIIKNTETLIASCANVLDSIIDPEHNNQQHYTNSETEDLKLIKNLAYQGLTYRYSQPDDVIYKRIEKELKTIHQKGFVSYFLIAWRITQYARSQGYYYVGRGSGANSIISYLLQITDVDPMELDLYFERFINLFRTSPPDFDIDFSWKDREDVTQFIFKEFKNVALLSAYSTFKFKSVIREIAKTFGLPEFEIKNLQQNHQTYSELGQLVLKYANVIQGFPSHLTVHSAGIVISEKPIHYFTSTFLPPKGFATTHFDMQTAEDVSLFKFDILGQRGLAKIKDTLALIKQQSDKDIDIHNINKLKKDVASNNLLKQGEAIGCFYVESPAMRMLLMKLKVDDYLSLVAASSVIRPGVAQSGMMREYIVRYRSKQARKKAKTERPILYQLMPETYGVMVYQEDVIKVAHYFADLSLAEADVLRRGMSGKFRSREEFKSVQDKFFRNCYQKGIAPNIVSDVWRQIESFAGYAFAKGHSASYAVESYQCLYLKAYYPLEFLVATVNNGGGFYSREVYLHEAKKYGAKINLPCINTSETEVILRDHNIYLGFSGIDALELKSMQQILKERSINGKYKSLRDFIHRIPMSLDQLILLIRSDAFRFTKLSKKELLWDAHFILGNKNKKRSIDVNLFQPEIKEFKLPPLWTHRLEKAYDELELFGFMVNYSAFDLVKNLPKISLGSRHFQKFINQKVLLLGYLIHIKNTRTKSGNRMNFATFIDVNGDWIDAVIFPNVLTKNPFLGKGIYLISGLVTEEFDFCQIEIHQHQKLNYVSLDEEDESIRIGERIKYN